MPPAGQRRGHLAPIPYDATDPDPSGYWRLIALTAKKGGGDIAPFPFLMPARIKTCLMRTAGGGMHQICVDLENRLITSTPSMIRAMPIMAGRSSDCLKKTKPMAEISTMPTPDQMA